MLAFNDKPLIQQLQNIIKDIVYIRPTARCILLVVTHLKKKKVLVFFSKNEQKQLNKCGI